MANPKYRIYDRSILGTGAAAYLVEASIERPADIETPPDWVPSLKWQPLNKEAEEAMQRLVEEHNKSGFCIKVGGTVIKDTGTYCQKKWDRSKFLHAKAQTLAQVAAVENGGLEAAGFKVEPVENEEPEVPKQAPSQVAKKAAKAKKVI